MPDKPSDPNSEMEDWLLSLKTSGDESPAADDPARLAAIVDAMHATGDALTPSEETRRATWRQIERAMESRSTPVQSGMSFLFRRFWGMPVFVPALVASCSVLLIGSLVWTMQTKDADMTVVAMRGGGQRIAVQDFPAQQPKPVQELREMGLEVVMQRESAQIFLTIPVTDPPSPALLAWAVRWGITPMPGRQWHIVLVPSSQAGHE